MSFQRVGLNFPVLVNQSGVLNTSLTPQFGANANASGANSVAIGTSALSSGSISVAVGNGSTASAAGAVAISDADATAQNAIAIGNAASATGVAAVAIGTSTVAPNMNSIAIGDDADATGVDSIAIGPYSSTLVTQSMALGPNMHCNLTGGVTIGTSTTAYTNTSTNNVTLVANGVGLMKIRASVRPITNLNITPVTSTTPTGGDLAVGIVVITGNMTLPSAASIRGNLINAEVGDIVSTLIVNAGAGNYTVSGGAGLTYASTPGITIATQTSRELIIRFTNVGAGTEAATVY